MSEFDERADTFEREQAVRDAQAPPLEITGDEPVAKPAAAEQTPKPEAKSDEIMIPKFRFDEVNNELKKIREQKPEAKAPDLANVESLINEKLAPLQIKLETDQVLRSHEDFPQFAAGALSRIKQNPSLSLEDAYRLEKFEHLESKAKEEGKTEAYQTIEKKSDLSFEQTGRKTIQKPVEEMIKDKTVPLSELAKMLPHA
jgi:hypothetical protein